MFNISNSPPSVVRLIKVNGNDTQSFQKFYCSILINLNLMHTYKLRTYVYDDFYLGYVRIGTMRLILICIMLPFE